MRPAKTAVSAVVLMIVCALAACSSQGAASSPPTSAASGSRITVSMITHGQAFDPFWSLVEKGAQTAASQYNVNLEYQSPSTTNPQAQATMITQAAAKKPAAMVVTIPDPAILAGPVRKVSSAGIPVVVVNVGDGVYQAVGALTYVGQPDYQAGEQAGKVMAAAGVHKALCIIFEAQNSALTDRCAGFSKQLASSGGSVQTLHVNGAQLHQAQSAIQQALQRDPSINGMLATGIIGFEAAGGALQTLNDFGKVKFGTFDVSSAGLTAVQNGQLLFVIDQQPFLEGYMSVQVAAFDVRYGQHPYQPIYTGPSFVTKANAAKVAQLYKNTGIPLFQGGYPQ
jgi:simple sugar transport system substrate-binding protein